MRHGEDTEGQDPRRHEPATESRPLSRWASFDLVEAAAEIQRADAMIGTVTSGKLELILGQIRALQDQARALLEQARTDSRLHRAVCRFRRRPGHVYHLYREDDDTLYFSMLSPDDWRGSPPHAFEGSYRLEPDMSWTPLEHVAERDAGRATLAGLLPGASGGAGEG